jgi:hypothetical protein
LNVLYNIVVSPVEKYIKLSGCPLNLSLIALSSRVLTVSPSITTNAGKSIVGS